MNAAYLALKPSECWDWLTARDLNQLAVKAYLLAKGNCKPPKGEPFLLDGAPWSSPADFADTLAQLLVLHLGAAANAAGIEGHEYAAAQLEPWYGKSPASDDNCPERSLQVMGHGCPASSAGGPGRESSQGVIAPNTPTAVISTSETAL